MNEEDFERIAQWQNLGQTKELIEAIEKHPEGILKALKDSLPDKEAEAERKQKEAESWDSWRDSMARNLSKRP